MTCGIYKIENKINKKIYIGQSIEIENRWKKHLYTKDDFLIHRAIQKYGKQCFDFSILEECDVSELNDKEQYWIEYYNSLMPNGYNMTPGGSTGAGLARGKVVEQYDLFGNFIAEYSNAHEANRQTGINYSDICACCRREKPHACNYQWKYKDNEDQRITNIFSSDLVLYNWPIQRYSLTGQFIKEYNNFKEACEDITVGKSSLCQCLKKKSKTCANSLWIYKGEKLIIPKRYEQLKNRKAVLQFDLNENFIKEFASITEASKETNIPYQNISKVCQKRGKTAGKYIWKFKKN